MASDQDIQAAMQGNDELRAKIAEVREARRQQLRRTAGQVQLADLVGEHDRLEAQLQDEQTAFARESAADTPAAPAPAPAPTLTPAPAPAPADQGDQTPPAEAGK